MDHIPCSASAALRDYLHSQEEEQPDFDPTEESHYEDILPKRFQAPVMQLLHRLWALETASKPGCFVLDEEKALKLVIEDLKELRAACEAEWGTL